MYCSIRGYLQSSSQVVYLSEMFKRFYRVTVFSINVVLQLLKYVRNSHFLYAMLTLQCNILNFCSNVLYRNSSFQSFGRTSPSLNSNSVQANYLNAYNRILHSVYNNGDLLQNYVRCPLSECVSGRIIASLVARQNSAWQDGGFIFFMAYFRVCRNFGQCSCVTQATQLGTPTGARAKSSRASPMNRRQYL